MLLPLPPSSLVSIMPLALLSPGIQFCEHRHLLLESGSLGGPVNSNGTKRPKCDCSVQAWPQCHGLLMCRVGSNSHLINKGFEPYFSSPLKLLKWLELCLVCYEACWLNSESIMFPGCFLKAQISVMPEDGASGPAGTGNNFFQGEEEIKWEKKCLKFLKLCRRIWNCRRPGKSSPLFISITLSSTEMALGLSVTISMVTMVLSTCQSKGVFIYLLLQYP